MESVSDEPAFTFIPLGGILQEFRVAGQNIVLGFSAQEHYAKYNSAYFGSTIGRTTNRLKDSVINNLNGQIYTITTKQGPNSLHGGKEGWNSKVFDGPKAVSRNGKEGLEFKYLSKDGDEGYPGTVELRVWYTAAKEAEEKGKPPKAVLEIEYEVEFVGDECEETAVGVTNHTYFNLSDGSTIEGTEAVLATNNYLPIDSTGIPIGTIENYTSTEVNKPFFLGATSPDIDDCFVMDLDPASIPVDTRSRPLRLNAAFKHQITGIHLEVHSTEPAFQFYTGKFINVPSVGGAPPRGPRSGFCVEPSRYINAPNEPDWRGMSVLKKGQIWGSKIVYKAWRE
ncbi:aldose 1-epimerase [[Emmonsia] crescens]|uniref:Aldose 1-epimerase n=1 Tax=[Emmonsia] crescens TaxID=73230 RepID=A0A0G2JAW5_9EURO|nr:aldose 1-epimerase [Emmonsia crescens UAMH 3008]